MTWEVARRAVDLALGTCLQRAGFTGGRPSAQLGYFGGEPLLEWPLLQRSAEYAMGAAERDGIALTKTVTTNMTLLDDEKSRWLANHGFYVGLSLDGDAAMHDTLRRYPDGRGSHAEAAKALPFLAGGQLRGEVIVVVDPRTAAGVGRAVGWLLEQGVTNISLNPNFYIRWPDAALLQWRAGYKEAAELYVASYRAGRPVRINVIDGKIRTRINDGYAACDRCDFGEKEIAVAPSGNIYPCERIVGDDTNTALRLGSVFTGFDPVKRNQVLAGRGNRNKECMTCQVRNRCMNWCSCINYATSGSTDRVSGVVCHHERMVIELADQVGETLYSESNPAFLGKFYDQARP